MVNQGTIGYKIGKKKYLMNVENDADLIKQISIRELYILLKYFNNIDNLREEFSKLKIIKKNNLYKKPKNFIIDKYNIYTNFEGINLLEELNNLNVFDWSKILNWCQLSYINIIRSGIFIDNGIDNNNNYNFLLDFNNNEIKYYKKDKDDKIVIYENIKIDLILDYEDMPIKLYNNIIEIEEERFKNYFEILLKLLREKEKIIILLNDNNNLLDNNIKNGANKMLDKLNDNIYIHHKNYRYFYNRLLNLDLIDFT